MTGLVFARTYQYKYNRGSKNGPGEALVHLRFSKPPESKDSFFFRTRPETDYETLTPGPGFYELEGQAEKIKDPPNSYSFPRSKRVGSDGEELCS